MIINRSRNFIFIHIPKSAGTSITARLSEYTQIGDVEVGGTPMGEEIQRHFRKRFGLHKHSTAWEIREKLGSDFSKFFKFAFVRNPYTRAVSLYNFICSWKSGPYYTLVKKMDFNEFLESRLFQGDYDICKPQIEWIVDKNGRSLVDYIGRVETIEESMNTALRQIDEHHIPRPIPKVNASELIRSDYLDKEATRIINHIYARDFSFFGYEMVQYE